MRPGRRNGQAWQRSIPCTFHAGSACGHGRSEEHTSELQSQSNLVCRLLLEKKKTHNQTLRLVQSAVHTELSYSITGSVVMSGSLGIDCEPRVPGLRPRELRLAPRSASPIRA